VEHRAILSYNGHLFGIIGDYATTPDVDVLAWLRRRASNNSANAPSRDGARPDLAPRDPARPDPRSEGEHRRTVPADAAVRTG